MIKRFTSLAVAVFALSAFGQAEAVYTLTVSGPTVTPLGITGTTLDFAIPTAVGVGQPSAGDFGQPFNVLNVGEPTASGTGTGFYNVSEGFTLTGPSGTETGTFSFTFSIVGAFSFLTNSAVSVTSGSGYTFPGFFYAPPTAGSSAVGTGGATANAGNVTALITPNAVPEPASCVMLGMGLVAGIGYGIRRRLVA